MSKLIVDVAVIGAGPGGYAAAIRCAQLSKKTLLIEKEQVGGTCLNIGCIPSKALISAAGLLSRLKTAESMGISIPEAKVDFPKLQEWKNGIVSRLTSGVRQLCRGNGVEILMGTACFLDPHTLLVSSGEEAKEVAAENIIVATGSVPAAIPGFSFDEQRVLSSTGALSLTQLPERMVVLGGGYIGLELGMTYARLGCRIAVVEMMKQLLPGMDTEASRLLSLQAKKLGMEVYLNSKALGLDLSGPGVRLTVETEAGLKPLEADAVLVAVGRRPCTEGLGLEKAGLQLLPNGFLPVQSDTLQTKVPHIFAIGDLAGNPMLAHKASKEADIAAGFIGGKPSPGHFRCIPAVVFTDPEIASVGLSLEEAKSAGWNAEVSKFPMTASGRAMTLRETDGFVKLTFDKDTHTLLGVVVAGAEASELIAEATLAVENGLKVEDLAHTVHAHPTLAETIMEAAKLALGEPIHMLPKRRI
jgi:dihydrolipoamide dehydrogenase